MHKASGHIFDGKMFYPMMVNEQRNSPSRCQMDQASMQSGYDHNRVVEVVNASYQEEIPSIVNGDRENHLHLLVSTFQVNLSAIA
ncbi:hypothetical protein QQP08_009984, partial [Theobroma cacao]